MEDWSKSFEVPESFIKALRFDTTRVGPEFGGGVAMRVTHTPTGTVVSGKGNGHYKLAKELVKELFDKVNERRKLRTQK